MLIIFLDMLFNEQELKRVHLLLAIWSMLAYDKKHTDSKVISSQD